MAASEPGKREIREVFARLDGGERILSGKQYDRPEQPTVYLSFDDGPSPLTEEILDVLEAQEVKATFFMLGQSAERYPQTVRRIIKEGHGLGNHTYDHDYEKLYGRFRNFWRQVKKTDEILYRTAGVRPRILRAPGGTHTNFDPFYFYYLDRAGFEIYDWNIDSGDSRRRGVPAREIVSNVKKGPFPHEVHVLMHDSAGHGETVKALPEIIRFFKQKGYRFDIITPEVEPVHHSAASPKWKRHYLPEQHEAFTRQAMAFRRETSQGENGALQASATSGDIVTSTFAGSEHPNGGGHSAGNGYMAGERTVVEEGRVLAHANPAGGSSGSEKNLADDGRIWVSLRTWTEGRGGSVSWDPQNKVAVEYYKGVRLRWSPETGTVERMEDRASTDAAMRVDMKWERGRIYVALPDWKQVHSSKIPFRWK